MARTYDKVHRETLAARLEPATFDAEDNTIDVVWYTGAQVLRGGWFTEPYMLKFEMSDEAADLEDLNGGASVLDTHNDRDLASVVGSVVRGTARLKDGKGIATIRLSREEQDAAVVGKIRDGIINKLSMGATIKTRTITEREGDHDLHTATSWSVQELSFVAVPADMATTTLAAETTETPAASVSEPEPEPETETARLAHEEQTMPDNVTAIEEALAKGAQEQRERTTAMRVSAKALNLSGDDVAAMCDGCKDINKGREDLINLSAARQEETQVSSVHAGAARITNAHEDDVAKGIEWAILQRYFPTKFDLSKEGTFGVTEDGGEPIKYGESGVACGRSFVGLRNFEMAREYLRQRGEPTHGSASAVSLRAIRHCPSGGHARVTLAHSTSDFPLILAQTGNKVLLNAFTEAPVTYPLWSARSDLPDFKTADRDRLGEFPDLDLVAEGEDAEEISTTESREQWSLATYANIFSLTKRVLVNDDMGAFMRRQAMLGKAAARREEAVVIAILTANANMADGNALFSAAHSNLIVGGGAPATAAEVADTRLLIQQQVGLDTTVVLGYDARYIICPTALQFGAEQLFSPGYTPTTAATAVAGTSLASRFNGGVIGAAQLDATSAVVWYMAADPNDLPGMVWGRLQGENGPVLTNDVKFASGNIRTRVEINFAAKAEDWRGLAMNPGV